MLAACVGKNYGTISSSYTTGTVSGDYYVGGLCGEKWSGTISSSFWDVETSGIGASGDNNFGATGKTTVEMQTQSTFTDVGWDFVEEIVNGTDDIWIMDGYPILLQYDILGGGDGSEGNPYLIKNIDDFNEFCSDSTYWNAGVYTRLECDLDLNPTMPGRQAYTQAPIAGHMGPDFTFDGTTFAGFFDGNGHIISNLTVRGVYRCGLFGCIDYGGVVTGLSLENANITGTDNSVGGLCGWNYGSISNSYVSGAVIGFWNVGGLCGV